MNKKVFDITYGLGDYTGVMFDFPDSYSFKKTLKKAIERGVDYVVKEIRIYDRTTILYKRVAIGWKIKVLTYEQAKEAFSCNAEILKQLTVHRQQGHKFFIVNDAKTEYAPLALYNRYWRLDEKEISRILTA